MCRVALLLVALCTALLTLAGVAGADDARGDDDGGRHGAVWVVNRDSGEVTIFDAASGAPLATIPTGAGAHEVAISRRAHEAYVTNELEDTISIVSTRTLASRKIAGPVRITPSRAATDGRSSSGSSDRTGSRLSTLRRTRVASTPRARIPERARTPGTSRGMARRSTSRTRPATRSQASTPRPERSSSASATSCRRARCSQTARNACCTCPLAARGR